MHPKSALVLRGFLLLCLAAASQQVHINDFAVPSEVKAGENTELQCTYGLDDSESDKGLFVKWWWTPLYAGAEKKELLYQRIVGQNANTLKHYIEIRPNDTIFLKELEPSDSGIFECEVSKIDEVRMHRELIVYTSGSGPVLNVSVANSPDESLLITCEANDVAPYPDLYITVNDQVTETSAMVTNSTGGLYNISTNATISEESAEGAKIRCELSFQSKIDHPLYADTLTYSSGEESASETPPAEQVEAMLPEDSSDQLSGPTDGGHLLGNSMKILFTTLTSLLLLQL